MVLAGSQGSSSKYHLTKCLKKAATVYALKNRKLTGKQLKARSCKNVAPNSQRVKFRSHVKINHTHLSGRADSNYLHNPFIKH